MDTTYHRHTIIMHHWWFLPLFSASFCAFIALQEDHAVLQMGLWNHWAHSSNCKATLYWVQCFHTTHYTVQPIIMRVTLVRLRASLKIPFGFSKKTFETLASDFFYPHFNLQDLTALFFFWFCFRNISTHKRCVWKSRPIQELRVR